MTKSLSVVFVVLAVVFASSAQPSQIVQTHPFGAGVRGWRFDPTIPAMLPSEAVRTDWSGVGEHEDAFTRVDFASFALEPASAPTKLSNFAAQLKVLCDRTGASVLMRIWVLRRDGVRAPVASQVGPLGDAAYRPGAWSDLSLTFPNVTINLATGDRLRFDLTCPASGMPGVTRFLADAAASRLSFVQEVLGAAPRTALSPAEGGTDPDFSLPDDDWAGLKRHLAIVNPPCGDDADSVLSLNGEWRFCARRYDYAGRIHGFQHLEEWPNERAIRVPGCWQGQGVGVPVEEGVTYYCGDNSKRPIRFFHNGSGWYRKTVVLPSAWAGRRIWLKTGGTRGRSRFWVNGNPVARLDDYLGTWKYDVTRFVKAGESTKVVVEVSNAFPNRNTQIDGSDRWGGIWREVAFESTPADVFIDNAWVRSDFDEKAAKVLVTIGGAENAAVTSKLRAEIEGVSAEQPIRRLGNLKLEIPLKVFRPWSPEHPNLYTAKVELVSAEGVVLQRRLERFGVRKLEVVGNEFRLNGKPFFVRGFGDDSAYPVTGLTPADKAFHLRHLQTARRAGFNFVRLHTHAEIEEYMDAADEAGIFVQSELSYYHDETEDFFTLDPQRDLRQLYLQQRRHPSFAVYSTGNEGMLGEAADRKVYEFVKSIDPDRLVINQDGGRDNNPGTADYRSGPLVVWRRGAYEPGVPFVAHEYQNLTVKTDPRLEKDFVGVWLPPVTMARRTAWLAKLGIGEKWIDPLQQAQHALQAYWQKDGAEMARLDPFCDGTCYWTIVDVTCANPAGDTFSAQGFLDPFWRTKKGGWTPEEFAKFNSPSCVLIDGTGRDYMYEALSYNPSLFDMPNERAIRYRNDVRRVFSTGEHLKAKVHFTHYGERLVEAARLVWRLVADGGRVLASDAREIGNQALGGVREIGAIDFVVPPLDRAVRARLEVIVEGSDGFSCDNSWTYYLFPTRTPRRSADVAVAPSLAAALAARYSGLKKLGDSKVRVAIVEANSAEEELARASGIDVIALSNQAGEPNIHLGWWCSGEQVGTAFGRHPMLGKWPFEPALCALHFRILKLGTKLPDENVAPEDLVVVGESATSAYCYLSDRRLPNGRHYIRVSGLDVLSDTPEGTALLDGILEYVSVKGP